MSEEKPSYEASKPLAYPQPTNFLQETGVSIAEPSLERIRVLVEETVRRVLHEKQYFFVLNRVLTSGELRNLEQQVKEGGLQSLTAYIPDIVAIEVPTFATKEVSGTDDRKA